MKRLIFIFGLLFFLSSCSANPDFTAEGFTVPSPESDYIFVCDLTSGKDFMYSANGDELIYPASTTKLLTALAALDVLSPESVIFPGDEVYIPTGNASSAYIRPGHSLTVEMLIEAMLLPSGNDAAYALSAGCGHALSKGEDIGYEEAVDEFIGYMNEFSLSLGCTSTHFTTPDGLAGEEHYTTLADMATIAKEAAGSDIIMKYASLAEDNVVYASGHTNTWKNTNLQLDKSSPYYNEHVKGMKTGSLDDNYSLITYYDDGESILLIGTFSADTKDGRYRDTAKIIEAYK